MKKRGYSIRSILSIVVRATIAERIVRDTETQVNMLHRLLGLSLFILLIAAMFPLPVHAAGFPIVGSLHSGKSPEAMAVDTQTHLLYIAHEGPGLVVAFDPLRGIVLWHVTLGDVATDIGLWAKAHLAKSNWHSTR